MLNALGAWLREQRLAHGWSVAEMGRQLHRAAKVTDDHTVPRTAILASYVRRWEAGKIGLTERYRLHYCTALGIPPTGFGPPLPQQRPLEALSPAPPVIPSDLAGSMVSAAPDGRARADVDHLASEPGDYRGGGTGHSATERAEAMSAAGSPELLMAMVAEESVDFGEWAGTSNIAGTTLEHYATQVRHLADDYQHGTPYPLLLETKRLRDRVFAKLRGHQRPGQAQELYLIAAQVCGLLAWMSGDMSFYRAADAHAWTGWVCADHADHDGARTWIRTTQSKLAYWDGRFIESAQLAEDGLRYHCPDSGQVMVALFYARALARLGRDQDAAHALGQARDGLERAGDDEVGGLWSVIPARFHSLASNVQVWRRDPQQVLTETTLALEQFETAAPREHNYGAEIHTRIDQAQAHLLLSDLDGAGTSLRPVLALAPENRYEPITQHLAQVRQALAQHGFRNTARAQQLQEEIETYCQESIVNGLTS
jgi:transcriptional regulator with XRE-family HTH domain